MASDAEPAPIDAAEPVPVGWDTLTSFVSSVLKTLELHIWPDKGYLIELEPVVLPLLYATPTGVEDDRILQELFFMLTIGLQGKAFEWRYRIDFDAWWDEEAKGYRAAIIDVVKPGVTPLSPPGDFVRPKVGIVVCFEDADAEKPADD
jgi:hypothetical protein